MRGVIILRASDIASAELLACSALWPGWWCAWWCWWGRAWCGEGCRGGCSGGRCWLLLHLLEQLLAKKQTTPWALSGCGVNRNATLGAIKLGTRLRSSGDLLTNNSLPAGRKIRYLLLHRRGCLRHASISRRTTEKAAIRAVFGSGRNSAATSGAARD